MIEPPPFASQVVLPETGDGSETLLDVLERRFPRIGRGTWERRIARGKILDENHVAITRDRPFAPGTRIYYFREVENEPSLPFDEEIVFSNDRILVASKPHFLPVTPSGPYVDGCLLNRLKRSTGLSSITPVHRIDRETAGLVVFSVDPWSRGLYQGLFMNGRVDKTYEAVTACPAPPPATPLVVENRIVPGEPFFRMKTEAGPANARTVVRCVGHRGGRALFEVRPLTGKKHQIRLHLSGLGYGIVNDRYYPELLPEEAPDFENPLQLVARALAFRDPVTGEGLRLTCARPLVDIGCHF
jgi:tRNA pseudouridine32 synthase/23S rRNA pseudouridine746 synthase